MQISPPFGYTEVVPFLKTHKVRLLAPGEAPRFVEQGHAVPISPTEFRPVARDYPIIFASGDAGKSYAPMAVLGINAGENLFYAAGSWTTGVYIPAYARRFPFCMTKVKVNNVARKERLICVEKSSLDESGDAMFDAEGAPSIKWKDLERLLGEYEADLERGGEMCAILSDYGLLEPFRMQATFKEEGARPVQITGMHRVAEKNLEHLNAAQLKNLMRKGILGRIYIHLLSLENFGRLMDRKAARAKA